VSVGPLDIKARHTENTKTNRPQPTIYLALPLRKQSLISPITAMSRPIRSTRSKVSPGLIDRPAPRRPTTVVAAEKAKKKQAAASKAEEQRHRAAQVAEVEDEIRRAQVEAQSVGQRARVRVTKKTFERPANEKRVRTFPSFTEFPTDPHISHQHRPPKLTTERGTLNLPTCLQTPNRLRQQRLPGTYPLLTHCSISFSLIQPAELPNLIPHVLVKSFRVNHLGSTLQPA
jgi:hypothetical protein